MNQREQWLKPLSKEQQWIEWRKQTHVLGKHWLQEVLELGYTNSTTATGMATTPPAVAHLTRRLQLEHLQDQDVVVEIGPGPGPMPQAILGQVRKSIRYIVVELNSDYADHLRTSIRDPRLTVLNENASGIGPLLQEMGHKARIALSSMPFSSDRILTESILGQLRDDVLSPGGKLLMWNFNPVSVLRVIQAFGREQCTTRLSPFNIPPLLTVLAEKKTLPMQPEPGEERRHYTELVCSQGRVLSQ